MFTKMQHLFACFAFFGRNGPIHQVVIQGAAIEDHTDAQIQPQHTQGHRIHGAVNIGVVGKIFHINGKGVGDHQPADSRQQRAGDAITEGVVFVG